jgi:hypothetical protein
VAEIEIRAIQNDLLGVLGVIICACFADSGGRKSSEVHVLLKEEHRPELSKKFRFDQEGSGDPEQIEQPDLLTLALREGDTWVSDHTLAFPVESIKRFQWQQASVCKIDKTDLIRLWSRGFLPALKAIPEATGSTELRAYLGPITQITPIDREDL